MAKAKSTKTQSKAKKPIWLKYTEQEVKDIILNIVKKEPELGAEKIGLILRDNYGIPKSKLYGIKIGKILKEADSYKNSDLENLNKKIERLEAHLEKNKQDKRTRRALGIAKARLKKTKEYLAKKEKK